MWLPPCEIPGSYTLGHCRGGNPGTTLDMLSVRPARLRLGHQGRDIPRHQHSRRHCPFGRGGELREERRLVAVERVYLLVRKRVAGASEVREDVVLQRNRAVLRERDIGLRQPDAALR